jgi:hypothetical protein
MSPKNAVRLGVVLPLVTLLSTRAAQPHAATKLRLTLATLHAAVLTTPRAAADSVDGPYFLVSVLGPHAKASTIQLPASGHLRIHRDEALGARPLIDLSLEPGDSVRLLVSVLAGEKVQASDEAAAAAASTSALSQPSAAWANTVTSALAPITKGGARWLGSATLLVTNDGGTTYWRSLECVATCKVLSGAGAAPLSAPVAGVVELSGGGATYHMQLQGQQTP